jgi:hypothetical protein
VLQTWAKPHAKGLLVFVLIFERALWGILVLLPLYRRKWAQSYPVWCWLWAFDFYPGDSTQACIYYVSSQPLICTWLWAFTLWTSGALEPSICPEQKAEAWVRTGFEGFLTPRGGGYLRTLRVEGIWRAWRYTVCVCVCVYICKYPEWGKEVVTEAGPDMDLKLVGSWELFIFSAPLIWKVSTGIKVLSALHTWAEAQCQALNSLYLGIFRSSELLHQGI